MESTSLDDLVSLAEALLVDRQRRRKLGVFVYGNKHALPDTAASNTPEVRGSSLLHPRFFGVALTPFSCCLCVP